MCEAGKDYLRGNIERSQKSLHARTRIDKSANSSAHFVKISGIRKAGDVICPINILTLTDEKQI